MKLLLAGTDRFDPFPTRLTNQFPDNTLGAWLRWDGYQPGMSAANIWRQAQAQLEPLPVIDATGISTQLAPDLDVLGLLVPAETRYRTPGEEWLFVVRHRADHTPGSADPDEQRQGSQSIELARAAVTAPPGQPTSASPPPTSAPAGPAAGGVMGWRYLLYRAAPAGRADLMARTPATVGLQDKRVLVVGVGAVGGAVATELARAGVARLDLVDGDATDPATACRQLAPVTFAGFAKTSVLQALLLESNPHVQVAGHSVTLGRASVAAEGDPDSHSGVAHLVKHADLVIDTAADPAVTRYLAALSRAQNRLFLHAAATAGAHGGVIALIQPGTSGCWWCLLHHRRDQTIPFPPAADPADGSVVPAGCAEPTFTGTGADLTTIAAQAARTAISILTNDSTLVGSTLYVAALRDHRGRPRPVSWRTRHIRRHPDCPMHHLPAGRQDRDLEKAGAATAQPAPATHGRSHRRSEPADRDGQHLENSTEETQDSRTGAHGRGGAASESGPTGGDPSWPPETAPAPAPAPATNH